MSGDGNNLGSSSDPCHHLPRSSCSLQQRAAAFVSRVFTATIWCLYFCATVQLWYGFQHPVGCGGAMGSLCHLCPWSRPVVLWCHWLYAKDCVWGASLLLWLLSLKQVRFWVLHAPWCCCPWSCFLCCIGYVAWKRPTLLVSPSAELLFCCVSVVV